MGINNSWLKARGRITTSGNISADDLEPGVYAIYVGESANLLNYPYGYGCLVSFFSGYGPKFQIMISNGNVKVSARSLWDSWSSWKELSID